MSKAVALTTTFFDISTRYTFIVLCTYSYLLNVSPLGSHGPVHSHTGTVSRRPTLIGHAP